METPRWRREIARRARAVGQGAWDAVRTVGRPVGGLSRRAARTLRWLLIAAAVLLLAIVALDVFIDEPLRASIERRMNAALHGYTVRIGGCDFSPWNLSLELTDLRVRQQAHPDPPVLALPAFRFSVEWRALLHLSLVADAELVRPRLHVNLLQLREERDDEVDLDERGWQEAVAEAYPLEINRLRIVGGRVTYIDEDPERPLELGHLDALATNIRNVADPGRPLPSTVRASARVFEEGSAAFRGRADFLAEPTPAFAADFRIETVPIERLAPVVEDYRLTVSRGTLSARGEVEYAEDRRRAILDEVLLDGIRIDYLNDPELTRRAAEAVAETGEDPSVLVLVRELRLADGELGFVNRAREPGYRVFLSGTNATVSGWSNHPDAEGSRFQARGAFMGSGRTAVRGFFRPDEDGADFDLAVAIEGTRLESMNDLLESYANLDVVDGTFSFYSEMRVANGRIDGYVKPLFHEVDVYEPEQDREEGFFHRLWERIAEGLGQILENPPREDVATVADVSGELSNPNTSNLQVVLNLIENAFFDAILPGFRDEAEDED